MTPDLLLKKRLVVRVQPDDPESPGWAYRFCDLMADD
jgi:hypothetical protein